MNMQLIDTHTDTHIWAEQYDRDLNDLFTVQSEIAQKVAQQLHAKISAAEKLAIERRPTGDLVAFDLYSRACMLLPRGGHWCGMKLGQAIDLLNQAVARDPSFFDGIVNSPGLMTQLYFSGLDHTPARLGLAEAAIQAAFRLRPDDGEAHLARAWHLYHARLDLAALWLNWKLPVKPCRIILGSTRRWGSS